VDDEGFVIRADVNQNDILQNKPSGMDAVRVYSVCVCVCRSVCVFTYSGVHKFETTSNNASIQFSTFILSAV